MTHAVEDGELRRVSPSQLKTFQDCQRKWFYARVLHIPEPPKAHFELGERIHKQFEDWYLSGIEPQHPSVRLALQLHDTPEPTDTYLIEVPRDLNLGLTAAGVPMMGRIDVLIPPVDGLVVVLDWKSTSSWNWLKTPEELARDAQGVVYLKYAMKEYPDATDGIFRHVYVRTKGGKGARTCQTDVLDRQYVDDMYESLERTVDKMKRVARLKDPNDVEPSPSECQKYGGCPYRGICPVTRSKTSSILDIGDDDMADLAKRIAEKNKALGINPPDAAKPAQMEKYVPLPAPSQSGGPDFFGPADPGLMGPDTRRALEAMTSRGPLSEQALPPLQLYIDCHPVKGLKDFQYLEDLITARTHKVITELAAQQPNMVPEGTVDVRECKFGSGVAALTADFIRNLPTGMVVASNTGLSAAVLEVLKSRASVVVVGGR